MALFVREKNVGGTSKNAVKKTKATRLSMTDFRIEFFVGILSKNRSRTRPTQNPMIKPPIRDSISIGR